MTVTPEDRRRFETLVSDRRAPQKRVWRAIIVLATADGCGTAEIMRRSGKSKPVGWRWQERFMQEGFDGLLRDKTRPPGKIIHAIVDNYATHKHPKVRKWLASHPRWTFQFTPTSTSWLNAVEGFFSTLTRRRLKRGVFHSVADLQAAINRFLAETNSDPKPFVWTANPKRVLAAVKRGKEKLESIH